MGTIWESDGCTPPDLKLLIVGPKRTGKSSVGNTLLGTAAFDTWGGAGTAVAKGMSEGRSLTVVDTYGWGSEEMAVSKQEKLQLLHALELCQPGPHVLLLVLPLLDFTHSDRDALQSRIELLTEGVWRHILLVFTLGDRLQGGYNNIQEYLRGGREHLIWLTAKCQNRYCVLNNQVKHDRHQVACLLEQVEDMLMENGHWHFSLHMYRRLEEDWSRREKELQETMRRKEGLYDRTPKGTNSHG